MLTDSASEKFEPYNPLILDEILGFVTPVSLSPERGDF